MKRIKEHEKLEKDIKPNKYNNLDDGSDYLRDMQYDMDRKYEYERTDR